MLFTKKYNIVLFFLSIQFQLYSQNLTFPVNCNDSLLMTIKGKYIKGDDLIAPATSSVLPKALQPEAMKRMEAMHKLLLEAYPQPIAMDGKWRRSLNAGLFADDVNYSNGITVCNYIYRCTFCSHRCVQNKPKEVSVCADVYNHFRVYVNQIGELQSDIKLDTMTINGQKVYMLNPLVGSWKGYDLYGRPGEKFSCVLLSRKGESPFTPVTRKQYLDYSIPWLNKFFDKMVNSPTSMPLRSLEEQEALKKKALDKIDNDYKNNPKNRELVRKNFLDGYKTDQQRRDETVSIMIKLKKDGINRYEKELEKAKADNLLDAPAEIYSPFTVADNTPIFAKGTEGGKMLVTANPAYIKKDLPKYVPQFMIVYWKWVSDWPKYGGTQGEYYKKMLETNFPIEKLQAMIDK